MLLSHARLAIGLSLLLLAGISCLAQTAEPPQPVEVPITAKPASPKTLTNSSITRMASAGLSDDLILQAIAAQPGQYTTDADALVDLKDSGVSERVITAMINKGRKRLATEAAARIRHRGLGDRRLLQGPQWRLAASPDRGRPHQVRRLAQVHRHTRHHQTGPQWPSQREPVEARPAGPCRDPDLRRSEHRYHRIRLSSPPHPLRQPRVSIHHRRRLPLHRGSGA